MQARMLSGSMGKACYCTSPTFLGHQRIVCLSSWSLVMRLLFCWDDASSRFYNSWSYDIMRSKFGRILAVMLMFDGFSVLRTLNIKGFRHGWHGSTPLETSNQLAKPNPRGDLCMLIARICGFPLARAFEGSPSSPNKHHNITTSMARSISESKCYVSNIK